MSEELPTLDEMEALEARAVPGPWRAGTHERWNVFALGRAGEHLGHEWVVAQANRNFTGHRLDAQFIAAARAFVPWAIARIRELEAALAEKQVEAASLEQQRDDAEQERMLCEFCKKPSTRYAQGDDGDLYPWCGECRDDGGEATP